jgi:hypothetical protein
VSRHAVGGNGQKLQPVFLALHESFDVRGAMGRKKSAKGDAKRGKGKVSEKTLEDLTPGRGRTGAVRGGISAGVLNAKAISKPQPVYPPIR